MAVSVIVSGEEKEVPFVKGDTVEDILEKAEINIQTVIIKRKGEIIPDDEEVHDGDELFVMKVVSGG